MNVTKNVMVLLVLVALIAQSAHAQGFSTRTWNAGSSAYGNGYGNRLVSPAYTAPTDFSKRDGSYWVERDPRYMSALPPKQSFGHGAYGPPSTTAYRPAYASSSYPSHYGGGSCSAGYCPRAASGYGGGSIYRGQGGHGRYPAANYPPATYPAAKPAFSPYRVPEGYYRGDGIFGKDTVFAENQPVRNFFRYIMP